MKSSKQITAKENIMRIGQYEPKCEKTGLFYNVNGKQLEGGTEVYCGPSIGWVRFDSISKDVDGQDYANITYLGNCSYAKIHPSHIRNK